MSDPIPGAEMKRRLRLWAEELAIDRIGVAAAVEPPGRSHLLEWLLRGHHAGMTWLARDPVGRCDPERILPGARSVVCVAVSYHRPELPPAQGPVPRVSRYAWGDDYHEVLGEKLHALDQRIRQVHPGVRSRIACDTSPIMEKAWAVAAGLAWQGKNTCLLHRDLGSWFFVGEIFLDLDLPPDAPLPERCGSCTRCLEACPTEALVAPNLLDARRCIAYWNIEHRGPFPGSGTEGGWSAHTGGEIRDWLVGCDICQEVCPWNQDLPYTEDARFAPRPGLADQTVAFWAEVEDAEYRDRVRGTAVTRIKPADMRRNARAIGDFRRAADP
jgi:epoxyqueuosine reductase